MNRTRTDTSTYTNDDILAEIEEVRALLKIFGYSTEGRHYKVSTHMWATKTWGRCKISGAGHNDVTICINPYVLKYGTPEHVHQLIAHEVCHSVIGANGHGAKWKAAAKALSSCGYKTIKRCESMPEVSAHFEKRPKDYKWQLTCNGCGNFYNYQRKSKVVQIALKEKGGYITCTHCNSRNFSVTQL